MKRAKWVVWLLVALFAGVATLLVRSCGDGRIAVLGPPESPMVLRLDGAPPVHLKAGARWAVQVGQGPHEVEIRSADGHAPARVSRVQVRQGGEQWMVPASSEQCFVLVSLSELADRLEGRAPSPRTKLVAHRFQAKPFLVPPGSELPENFASAARRDPESQEYRFLLSDVACAQLAGPDEELADLVLAKIDIEALRGL